MHDPASPPWRAIRSRLDAARLPDEVISAISPSALGRGRWWPPDMAWPDALLAGVLEPRKGYQFRPENVTLPLLLRRWLQGREPVTALDLGCGSGSLLLAARYALPSVLRVAGVEQQPAAADRCRRTLLAHGLPSAIICGDLRDPATLTSARAALRASADPSADPSGGADLVVMNPPFFPAGWGAPSQQESTRLSTHAERGDVADFLAAALTLLSADGLIVSLFDAQRLCELLAAASALGLGLTHLAWIPDQRPGLSAQPFRVWVGLRPAQGCVPSRIDTDSPFDPWDQRPPPTPSAAAARRSVSGSGEG
jgi:tRNA1(Val) A37 N6-methylase TrmN6